MPEISEKTEVLLFDLGGVLVEFTGYEDAAELLPESMSHAALVHRWANCPHIRAFETGQIDASSFAQNFVADWQLTIAPDEFRHRFAHWANGLYPGARELLAELRSHYRLACLSNSNSLHWQRIADVDSVQEEFELAMSSHELGFHKPDRRIFDAALARLSISADKVAFFDDSLLNIEGAKAAGLQAFRTRGVTELQRILSGRRRRQAESRRKQRPKRT